jgi:hypothetical protein
MSYDAARGAVIYRSHQLCAAQAGRKFLEGGGARRMASAPAEQTRLPTAQYDVDLIGGRRRFAPAGAGGRVLHRTEFKARLFFQPPQGRLTHGTHR